MSTNKKQGWLIVITGPSGVGKKTLWSQFINEPQLNLVFSVSMTTRKPREGEQEGKDYFFVSKQQFENAIKNNELLEHAIYVNQYYGTPLGYVKQQLQQGKNVFLEIETKGALQIFEFAKKHPEINLLSIFIAPPSLECLRQRLINRKTESIEAIEQRLKVVQEELTKQKYFHHVVINDDYKKASQKLKEIITSSISKN